jgi:hypothetical protein
VDPINRTGTEELHAVAEALRAHQFDIILRTVGFDAPEWASFIGELECKPFTVLLASPPS